MLNEKPTLFCLTRAINAQIFTQAICTIESASMRTRLVCSKPHQRHRWKQSRTLMHQTSIQFPTRFLWPSRENMAHIRCTCLINQSKATTIYFGFYTSFDCWHSFFRRTCAHYRCLFQGVWFLSTMTRFVNGTATVQLWMTNGFWEIALVHKYGWRDGGGRSDGENRGQLAASILGANVYRARLRLFQSCSWIHLTKLCIYNGLCA